MSPKMPNSRRNLDTAIERVFDDREAALRMRRVMANVIVGQLLPDGVVKGGSAMKIRFGFAATRVSSDLDTARAKDIEAFIGELDWVKTRETCIRLFNYRRKQAWPPVVSKGEDWERLYDAQRGDLDVEASVDGAIAWTNDLIKKIDSASREHAELEPSGSSRFE